MYFKVSLRHNPATDTSEGYYRLVESYRNEVNRVCHRTLLNVGFLRDLVDVDQLNQVRRILCNRYEAAQGRPQLFEIEKSNSQVVNDLADEFWGELVKKNRVDVGQKAKKEPTARQRGMVFEESLRHQDVREVGSEWLCYQALEQLKMADLLSATGFTEEEVQLAITQIISRAVYPASELETSRWIRESSAVCELTGYPLEKVTKDKLYQSALRLLAEKEKIERFLSVKTSELFDLADKIYLYDLTNTYFEGRKRGSQLAQYGRSKEKRGDCKIVVLALVVNPEGFIKCSTVFEGNLQDCTTLKDIVESLRGRTSQPAKRGIVVVDAGVGTDSNLAMLAENGFDYICVSRSRLKDYKVVPGSETVEVEDKKRQKIQLQKVTSERHSGYFLKVESEAKRLKEMSMNNRFQEGFEKGLRAVAASLGKKGGIKIEEKVHERVGRLKQKYPSVSRHYDISYSVDVEAVKNRKTKESVAVRTVKSMAWSVKQDLDPNAQSGVYFLRTSLQDTERILWDSYNAIREIEYSFRTLKTDLDLRPIYHKKDSATMAHLHLGLLAYWVVNTVRFQLKRGEVAEKSGAKQQDSQEDTAPIKVQWKEIVRIMNTQKAVTTTAQNRYDEVIIIRRCSDPNEKVQAIYSQLRYPSQPFPKRNFVVHKSEFKKNVFPDYHHFPT
jgi:hypothetical protein